jgi:hypothetical protein
MNDDQINELTKLQALFPAVNCGNQGPELQAGELAIIHINTE